MRASRKHQSSDTSSIHLARIIIEASNIMLPLQSYSRNKNDYFILRKSLSNTSASCEEIILEMDEEVDRSHESYTHNLRYQNKEFESRGTKEDAPYSIAKRQRQMVPLMNTHDPNRLPAVKRPSPPPTPAQEIIYSTPLKTAGTVPYTSDDLVDTPHPYTGLRNPEQESREVIESPYNPTSPDMPADLPSRERTELFSPVSVQSTVHSDVPSSVQSVPFNPTSPDMDSSSDDETTEKLSAFTMAALSINNNIEYIIDSGASRCGVRTDQALTHITPCQHKIIPAFGPPIVAKSLGHIQDDNLGDLKLEALHIESMHHNLLSVHQICSGGGAGQEQFGVFTKEGCHFFNRSDHADILKALHPRPSTFQASASQGVYIYTSTQGPQSH